MHAVIYILGVAAATSTCALVLTGIGLFVLRSMGRRATAESDVLLAPWLGWCTLLGMLQLWHLWLPVDGRAIIPAVSLSAAGFLLAGRPFWSALFGQRRQAFASFLAGSLVAVWVASHTTAQPAHPDSAFYHLMAVRWAAEYPIVPGLGNLQGQLAFNNSFFLYAALLDLGPFTGRSHHLASGVLLFLAILRSLSGLRQLILRRHAPVAWRLYDALFLVPLVVYTMGVYGSSPSPDVGVYVLGVVVGSELLRMTTCGDALSELRLGAREFLLLVFVCAIGVTVKLSFAGYGAAACTVALLLRVRREGWKTALRPRVLAAAFAVGGFTIGLWMLRGVILSGYIAYPSTLGGFAVDWRMPLDTVRLHAAWVRSWARTPGPTPGEVLCDSQWLWPWFNRTLRSTFAVTIPMTMVFLLSPSLLLLGDRPGCGRRLDRGWLFMVLPLAGLLFWFFTAPDIRFAGGAFWVAGLGATALACRGLSRATVLAIVFSLTSVLLSAAVDPFEFLKPWHMDIRPAKRGAVQVHTTESGLSVNVPGSVGSSWNAPLPCTSFFNPRLRARTPGRLGDGFAVNPAPPSSNL